MEVSSTTLRLPAGQAMGGYGGVRLSAQASEVMEVNTWAFADASTGRLFELCSIDALYAGDLLATTASPGKQRIFAASHTHCGPMLDSSKPELGACAKEALQLYTQAVTAAPRQAVQADLCRVYRAEVEVPIYRRFDWPDTAANRWLAGRAGMYPNSRQSIDKHLYLFEFSRGGQCVFTLAYHACHPVTRGNADTLSPDYVAAVRSAVRHRFGAVPCLFLLGCAGDIRPNFACKRVPWLPSGRLNWRFEWPASAANMALADSRYAQAVAQAPLWQTVALQPGRELRVEQRSLPLAAPGPVPVTCLVIGDRLRFEFLPFEVSHLFHLDAIQKDPMRFTVSCADHTLGYLPHPRQIRAGGYEVDGSRACMGLAQRPELVEGASW